MLTDEEFRIVILGTLNKMKKPSVDTAATLDLIVEKLNQHDQYFADVKSEIKNTN